MIPTTMPRPRAPGQPTDLPAVPESPNQTPKGSSPAKESGDGIDDLNFRQARNALDLTLAELQSSELDVEAMADLYRRALRYADRCEAVLQQVEQEVMQWDPQAPDHAPEPLDP
jgi:exodeoxyribonuclease VII small subunit